ncbi:MAG: hypothetical protein NWP54_03415 [Polaribacter sp.]|nr:hypothetical protein [Polaribacter sp.]
MKKIILLFSFALFLFSCSETEPTIEFKILPIKEAQTPAFFEHGTIDTISVKYDLPNGCHQFWSGYYEYDKNARIVAVNAINDLESICTQTVIEKEIKIPIQILQQENYLFRFYKGKDTNGKSIFEEIEVPVR